jgi:hypothetical protein
VREVGAVSFIHRLWFPWVQRPLDGLHLRTRKSSHQVGVGPLECNSQCGHFSRAVCCRRSTLFPGRPDDDGCFSARNSIRTTLVGWRTLLFSSIG